MSSCAAFALFEFVTLVLRVESSTVFAEDTFVTKLLREDCTLLCFKLHSLRTVKGGILDTVPKDGVKLLVMVSELSEFKSHLSNEIFNKSGVIVSVLTTSVLKLVLALTLTVSGKISESSSLLDDKLEMNDKLDSFISTSVFGEYSEKKKTKQN